MWHRLLESRPLISRGLLTARAGKGCSPLLTRVPPPPVLFPGESPDVGRCALYKTTNTNGF